MVAISLPLSPRWSGIRLALAVNAIVWIVVAIGLYFESSLVTWIWPWNDARMTYIFFASIAAAVAAPLAWIATVNEPAALAGVAIDGLVIGTFLTLALGVMGVDGHDARLLTYAAVTAALTAGSGILFRRFNVHTHHDQTPQPILVRALFGLFSAILIPVGIALILRVGAVFPWTLPGHTSTVIGGVFIGASTYFAYGIYRGVWVHSGGQLAGFLAYDLILAVPYWRTLFDRNAMSGSGGYQSFPDLVAPNTSDVNDTSLYVYTAVITLSGLIAIYFLFIGPETRFWHQRASGTVLQVAT